MTLKHLVQISFLAVATLGLASCRVHHFYHADDGVEEVVVVKGHVHTDTCGHFFHHGRWYMLRNHVHGPHCGHAFVGGVWIVRE